MLVSEVDADACSYHCDVKYVEEHYIPVNCFVPGLGSVCCDKNKLADECENLSDPDEEVEGKAYSLS